MLKLLKTWPIAKALITRPSLWPVALALVPPGWWRRRPPLPVPPREYLRFREQTMYGGGGALAPDDVVAYLKWCRRMRRAAR